MTSGKDDAPVSIYLDAIENGKRFKLLMKEEMAIAKLSMMSPVICHGAFKQKPKGGFGMQRLILILLILTAIGCAPPRKVVRTTPETKKTTTELSLDERAKIFYNKIAETQTTIDQATFLKYYRLRAAELGKSGLVKMSKPEVAQQATQLFRQIDQNHDKEITVAELKFALATRARERRRLRRMNPKEWHLLDDAF